MKPIRGSDSKKTSLEQWKLIGIDSEAAQNKEGTLGITRSIPRVVEVVNAHETPDVFALGIDHSRIARADFGSATESSVLPTVMVDFHSVFKPAEWLGYDG